MSDEMSRKVRLCFLYRSPFVTYCFNFVESAVQAELVLALHRAKAHCHTYLLLCTTPALSHLDFSTNPSDQDPALALNECVRNHGSAHHQLLHTMQTTVQPSLTRANRCWTSCSWPAIRRLSGRCSRAMQMRPPRCLACRYVVRGPLAGGGTWLCLALDRPYPAEAKGPASRGPRSSPRGELKLGVLSRT